MSHLVNINIELKNTQTAIAACRRLGWKYEENQRIMYHDKSSATGLVIYIPEWRYPITITENGTVKGDNYNGSWGDPALLNKLRQAYGIEAARALMRRHTAPVVETQNQDGSVTLTVRY